MDESLARHEELIPVPLIKPQCQDLPRRQSSWNCWVELLPDSLKTSSDSPAPRLLRESGSCYFICALWKAELSLKRQQDVRSCTPLAIRCLELWQSAQCKTETGAGVKASARNSWAEKSSCHSNWKQNGSQNRPGKPETEHCGVTGRRQPSKIWCEQEHCTSSSPGRFNSWCFSKAMTKVTEQTQHWDQHQNLIPCLVLSTLVRAPLNKRSMTSFHINGKALNPVGAKPTLERTQSSVAPLFYHLPYTCWEWAAASPCLPED